MSIKTLRMSLSVLAAAAVAIIAGPAHAGFYDSEFDPIIFNGLATFQIGNDCLSQNGVHRANSNLLGPCHSVDMEAIPAPLVELHNGSNTSTLDFSLFSTDISDMQFVAVIDGKFAGITTLPIGSFRAVNTGLFPDYYFLEFLFVPTFSGGSDDNYRASSSEDSWGQSYLSSVQNSVLLFDCPKDGFALLGNNKCSLADTATNVHFTLEAALVPEPGTLALILGGLGVGWMARRRKAAA
jgi:hypothetical protein